MGDLSDLGTSVGTSTLSIYGVVPSAFIASPALTVSSSADIILENNSYDFFGNFSNAEIAIKASKYS